MGSSKFILTLYGPNRVPKMHFPIDLMCFPFQLKSYEDEKVKCITKKFAWLEKNIWKSSLMYND